MDEFKKLGLSEKTLKTLKELNFTIPTDIQLQTIPLILKDKDLIGNAETGSGKTLAFVTTIIEKIIPGKGIQALILTPTRELTIQIAQVINLFSKNANLNIQEVYGGVSIVNQIRGVKKADIIVGTPGRILDHLQRGTLDFMELKILVLDEADRMVDMGFLPDVEKIIRQCPIKRQTLLFSATSSSSIDYIAEKYMKEPIEIAVGKFVDASKLHQFYYDTPPQLKFSLLVDLLKKEKSGIIMIFCNTRRNVDMLVRNLQKQKIESHAIHGGLSQDRRSKIMVKFHENKAEILVCTDVAARGLDIKGVTHVYNYDLPKTPDEYVHRIGRTARAGEKGLVLNIVSKRDYDSFNKIMHEEGFEITKRELPRVEMLSVDFKSQTRPGEHRFGGGGYRGGGGGSGGGRSYGGGGGRSYSKDSKSSGHSRPPRRDNNSSHSRDSHRSSGPSRDSHRSSGPPRRDNRPPRSSEGYKPQRRDSSSRDSRPPHRSSSGGGYRGNPNSKSRDSRRNQRREGGSYKGPKRDNNSSGSRDNRSSGGPRSYGGGSSGGSRPPRSRDGNRGPSKRSSGGDGYRGSPHKGKSSRGAKRLMPKRTKRR